jgi:RNA polymerase sigma-70 factor (sigma-E family)
MKIPTRLGSEFDTFVNAYSAKLLRSAYLLTWDLDDAQDLVQITLFKTARRWSVAQNAPEAYSRRVLINANRDRLRALERRPHERTSLPALNACYETASYAQQVADHEALGKALRLLDEAQREVIVLRYFLDLTVADTAKVLRLPEGTVKSHASRGLTRMRVLLSRESTERGKCRVDRG